MPSRSAGPGGASKRLLIALVSVGVVLGAWRWVGQGVDVTDPRWLSNVTDTVAEFGSWARGLVSRLGDQLK